MALPKMIQSGELVTALKRNKGHQSKTARELGVTPQAIQHRLKNDPAVRSEWQKFVKVLEKAGGSNQRIAKAFVAGLSATKTASYEGEVFSSDQPDHELRMKAAEQCLKIKRLIPEEDPKAPEQHLHLHFEDRKTSELHAEIMSQLAERRKRQSGIPSEPISGV